METKKNYRKPEYDEVVLNANMSLMSGSTCTCDQEHGITDDDA